MAVGTADAYVDFENLDGDAVTLSADGESATIVLPAPEMSEVRIDPEQSRVVDRDRGLVERVGAAFIENPTDDSELYALAERRIGAAAAESDLLDRAEANTRDMLTTLAMSSASSGSPSSSRSRSATPAEPRSAQRLSA